MIRLLPALALAAVLAGCNGSTVATAEPEACRGEPDPDRFCTQQYDPVCGCDGRTWPNACAAETAGVLRHTPGACGEPDPPEA